MPKFTVQRRVDAYVFYEAEVEAKDAAGAAETAKANDGDIDWTETSTNTFDDRSFVTLDDDGLEIDGTGTD